MFGNLRALLALGINRRVRRCELDDPGVQRSVFKVRQGRQRVPSGLLLGRVNPVVRQAQGNGVGGGDGVAGQGQPGAICARAAAQKIAAADVGKQADQRLGHGHFGVGRNQAVARALAQAHAAPVDDAV